MHIIIPALNEEKAIGGVVRRIRCEGFERIVVVDNGSTDGTSSVASQAGALIIEEKARGYGAACLAGIGALDAAAHDIVVFVDGDSSDDTRDIKSVIEPLLESRADFVIGSRVLGVRERGALPAHARAGNALATWLIRMRTGVRYTDLGPLRALRYGTLERLGMRDRDYGWTVEMQLKAAQQRLRITEVPVRYYRRVGRSKISGTVVGSLRAGLKIMSTIIRHGR